MSGISKILWILLFLSLAIGLDIILLRIWRTYRQLTNAQKTTGTDLPRRTVFVTALRTVWSDFQEWHHHKFQAVTTRIGSMSSNRSTADWLAANLLNWSVVNLSLALLALYAGQFLMVHIPDSRGWGLIVLLGGGALAFFRQGMVEPAKPDWIDVLQIGLGGLICLPLILNVNNWMVATSPYTLISIWGVSILLVAVPALKQKPVQIIPGWPKVGALSRNERIFLICLLVGAFLLRFVAVGNTPGPIDPDEASLGLFMLDVAEGRYVAPFGVGWATHPALQFFFVAPLVNLIQHPIVLMRMPAVILGTLAVGTFYLAARVGWGRRIGVLVGLMMMTSDVEIHFSRLGVNNISDSLFASWMMAALWTAASQGHPLAFILTGIGLGLSQYYYFGNRALPFVIIAILLAWLLLNRRQVLKAWRLLLYTFVISLVVAGPLLGLWIRDPYALDRVIRVAQPFSKNIENQALGTGESHSTLWQRQISDSLLVFTVVPDRGTFYNPGRAMLPSILAPFFYIGLFVLLKKWKQPASVSTVIWILVTLILGSMLINTAATFQRLLGLYPGVILVTAIGLETSARILSRHLPSKVSANKLIYTALAFIAVGNLYFYFYVFNTQVVWKVHDQEAIAIAVREYQETQNGTYVLHTDVGIGDDGTVYLPVVKLIAKNNFFGDISQVEIGSTEKPVYIYILNDKFDELTNLQDRFPGGNVSKYMRSADGEVIMIRYTVP